MRSRTSLERNCQTSSRCAVVLNLAAWNYGGWATLLKIAARPSIPRATLVAGKGLSSGGLRHGREAASPDWCGPQRSEDTGQAELPLMLSVAATLCVQRAGPLPSCHAASGPRQGRRRHFWLSSRSQGVFRQHIQCEVHEGWNFLAELIELVS